MRKNQLVIATLFVYAVALSSSSAHAGGLLKKIFKKKAEPAPACEPAPAPEPSCCEPAPPPEPTCCEPAPAPEPVCCEPAPACPEPAPAPCCEPAPEPPACCASLVPTVGTSYVITFSEGPIYAVIPTIPIQNKIETVVRTSAVSSVPTTFVSTAFGTLTSVPLSGIR